MPAPTASEIGQRILRQAFGVRSLNPASPANQASQIEDGDLDDIAGAMTQAFQEIDDLAPQETKNYPKSCYLNAPASLTLTVTTGSNSVSLVTLFAPWMPGCTIRITGDTQDNELLTETTLARPFMGSDGDNISAIIYADCVQLDETIGEIIADSMLLNNQLPIAAADTFSDFMRLGNYPMLTDARGMGINSGLPYFYFNVRKPDSNRPLIFFIDSLYEPSLDYVPRKIRFSPMPNVALSIGYRVGLNPPRILAEHIDNGDHVTDPGVTLPTIDGKVESIFMPIVMQIMTSHPKFKNEAGKAEIARSYKMAVARLENSGGKRGATNTVFH